MGHFCPGVDTVPAFVNETCVLQTAAPAAEATTDTLANAAASGRSHGFARPECERASAAVRMDASGMVGTEMSFSQTLQNHIRQVLDADADLTTITRAGWRFKIGQKTTVSRTHVVLGKASEIATCQSMLTTIFSTRSQSIARQILA